MTYADGRTSVAHVTTWESDEKAEVLARRSADDRAAVATVDVVEVALPGRNADGTVDVPPDDLIDRQEW